MVEDYEVMKEVISDKKNSGKIEKIPLIKLLPSGFVLSAKFIEFLQRVREMKVRPDDVWVCGHPRCGTTWTTEMVWLIAKGFNFDAAKSIDQIERSIFLDAMALFTSERSGGLDSVTFAENKESPRIIKSHLPPPLLPSDLFTVNPKIVYVTRNPKDAAISYYYYHQLWCYSTGSKDDFFRAFLDGKLMYSPFWGHLLSFWNLRHQENILIISYEDMIMDLPTVITKIADFLDVSYTNEQKTKLIEYLNFKSMKKNPMVNLEEVIKKFGKQDMEFIRNGKINSWKNEMSPKMAEEFDLWTKENLEGSDFPYYLNNN